MTIGQLRDRVTLLRATTADDGHGGQTVTWGAFDTAAAAILALSGREVLMAGAMQLEMSHRITLHYRTDVTVQSRVRRDRDGQVFDVQALRDPDGRRRWLELDAQEVDS